MKNAGFDTAAWAAVIARRATPKGRGATRRV